MRCWEREREGERERERERIKPKSELLVMRDASVLKPFYVMRATALTFREDKHNNRCKAACFFLSQVFIFTGKVRNVFFYIYIYFQTVAYFWDHSEMDCSAICAAAEFPVFVTAKGGTVAHYLSYAIQSRQYLKSVTQILGECTTERWPHWQVAPAHTSLTKRWRMRRNWFFFFFSCILAEKSGALLVLLKRLVHQIWGKKKKKKKPSADALSSQGANFPTLSFWPTSSPCCSTDRTKQRLNQRGFFFCMCFATPHLFTSIYFSP